VRRARSEFASYIEAVDQHLERIQREDLRKP
jgi:hypothetical protein